MFAYVCLFLLIFATYREDGNPKMAFPEDGNLNTTAFLEDGNFWALFWDEKGQSGFPSQKRAQKFPSSGNAVVLRYPSSRNAIFGLLSYILQTKNSNVITFVYNIITFQ